LPTRAVKGFSGPSTPAAGSRTSGTSGEAPPAGGLGGILDSLGVGNSPLARGLGSLLSGGLGDLLKQFQGAGKADVAESWVGTGQNRQVAAEELGAVLSEDQIAFLMERTGLSRDHLLKGLADGLPRAVDELTPSGRLPTPGEINNAI